MVTVRMPLWSVQYSCIEQCFKVARGVPELVMLLEGPYDRGSMFSTSIWVHSLAVRPLW